MAVSLTDLDDDFAKKVTQLLAATKARGVEMRPYTAVRTPIEQAKLWRQSRSTEEITERIARLKKDGAPFLAKVLEDAGPQHGGHVTNALPGFSWHQWAEAVDCFWLLDGRAEWSTTKTEMGLNGYQVYAEEAKKLGLEAGGYWTSLKDWPHVQLRSAPSPAYAYTLPQIDAEMKARFDTTD